jgi:hypothetical protein
LRASEPEHQVAGGLKAAVPLSVASGLLFGSFVKVVSVALDDAQNDAPRCFTLEMKVYAIVADLVLWSQDFVRAETLDSQVFPLERGLGVEHYALMGVGDAVQLERS